jgi:hypothetical protein
MSRFKSSLNPVLSFSLFTIVIGELDYKVKRVSSLLPGLGNICTN